MRIKGRLAAAVLAGAVVLGFTGLGPAFASTPGYPVVPSVHDPGHAGGITSAWSPHTGEPGTGDTHGLTMGKDVPTATNAAAIATLMRVGRTVWQDQLGFDYAPLSNCTAGAPRFDVYDTTGAVHFFGCAHGTLTVNNSGWTQVRFTGADAFPPIASGTPVSAIFIVMDEQGLATLDNIYYDGATMGKPGA
jgi:hypothetical protein